MQQKINLNDIAKELAHETGLSNMACKVYADKFVELIRSHVESGQEVSIKNLGKFEMTYTAPKKVVTAIKGEKKEINIASRKRIKFTMSRHLAAVYNGESEGSDK